MQPLNVTPPNRIDGAGTTDVCRFLFLIVLFMFPSILNLFPFYFPDSAGYVGSPAGFTGFRSVTPNLVSYPLYKIIGPWALAVINSGVLSFAFIRFVSVFRLRFSYPIFIGGALATSLSVMASTLMPDVWGFVALLLIVLLIERWSWLDFFLAALMVTGHGANPVLLCMMLPIALALYPRKLIILTVFGSVLFASSLLAIGVDKLTKGEFFPETYAGSILASKMLHDVPQALDDLCADRPDSPICAARSLIEPPVDKPTDYYVWRSRIGKPEAGGLTRVEFNRAGYALFFYALTRRPLNLLKVTAESFLRYYSASNWQLPTRVKWEPDNAYIHWLIQLDQGILVPTGFFNSRPYRMVSFFLNNLILAATFILAIVSFKKLTPNMRQLIVFMFLALVSNDFIFALISGASERYHDRMLAVVIPIGLTIASVWRKDLSDADRGNENANAENLSHPGPVADLVKRFGLRGSAASAD